MEFFPLLLLFDQLNWEELDDDASDDESVAVISDSNQNDVYCLLFLHLMDGGSSHAFCSSLSLAERRRRSGSFRRGALHAPYMSYFSVIFVSGQDDALVALCGFDQYSFRMLLDLFDPLFGFLLPYADEDGFLSIRPNPNRGRPRSVTATECLALALAWTRTRGPLRYLCIIFGVTLGRLSIWNRFARRIIIFGLINHPLARVAMPSEDELLSYVSAISAKYPILTDVWGAMDGLKIHLHASTDGAVQNRFYNGWLHSHFICSLFLFSPDGRVRATYFNAPGTMHDSTMAEWSGVCDALDGIYNQYRLRIVADSAFASEQHPSILPSYQTNYNQQGQIRQASAIHSAATSVRQLSEWGMRGFQASFPRLQDGLLWEERGERKVILQLIILLYNFRASTVGQNQISSSYFGVLRQDAFQHLGH